MKVKVKSLSRVGLIAIPWTVAHQAPPPMGFSKHEYWSGLPFFLQRIFLTQGWQSLVGCHLWGHTESDTTEVT